MAREILLSKKTEQGLRLDPRTKLLLIFIISIFVMGGTGGEAMGLIRLVLCTVPAILLLTSKQCAKAVGYIAVFSADGYDCMVGAKENRKNNGYN